MRELSFIAVSHAAAGKDKDGPTDRNGVVLMKKELAVYDSELLQLVKVKIRTLL